MIPPPPHSLVVTKKLCCCFLLTENTQNGEIKETLCFVRQEKRVYSCFCNFIHMYIILPIRNKKEIDIVG